MQLDCSCYILPCYRAGTQQSSREGFTTLATASPTHRRSGFDEGILLRELVAALEPDRRDAFVLTQMLGLDYASTADVCGCPIGTIRSRVARARAELIREMNAPGLAG